MDQTKRLFKGMENLDELIPLENVHSSGKSECYDLNGLFASLISGNSSNINYVTPVTVDNFKELKADNSSVMKFNQLSSSMSDIHNGRVSLSQRDAANLDNQLRDSGKEGPILLSDNPTTQFEQSFPPQSITSAKSNSADKVPCMSTWSCERSILTSIEPQLASASRVQDSADAVLSRANSLESCRNGCNIQGNSTFSSLYSEGELTDMEKHVHGNSGNLLHNHQPMPSVFASGGEVLQQGNSLHGFPKELCEEFKPTDFTTDLFNFYLADDLSQWFASSPDQSINPMTNALSDDLSQLVESTSATCSLVGGDVLTDIPIEHPAHSVHSSVTNTVHSSVTNMFNAEGHVKSAIVHSVEKGMYDGLRPDIGCSQVEKCWEDLLMPISSGVCSSTTSSALSKCVSEMDVRSVAGSRKGLFSELGLEELLVGTSTSCSVTNSNLEDQSSPNKKRKMENSSVNSNQAQVARVSGSSGSMSLLNYNLARTGNHVTKKEVIPKSQVGLWIDDSYSITAGSAVLSQQQKPEEHTKATRKRARPGESTRPRPKDRQQIQDRIKELRGIIPSGGKVLSF